MEVSFHISYYSKPLKFQGLVYLKRIHLHLLWFKIRFLNAKNVIEFATWRISVLIFIIVSIMEIKGIL